MTLTATESFAQATPRRARASLDDQIGIVQRAICNLDSASADLEAALESLEGAIDDANISAAGRELADEMSRAAFQVRHDFECGDFDVLADQLELLAAEEADAQEEDDDDGEDSDAEAENEPSLTLVTAE